MKEVRTFAGIVAGICLLVLLGFWTFGDDSASNNGNSPGNTASGKIPTPKQWYFEWKAGPETRGSDPNHKDFSFSVQIKSFNPLVIQWPTGFAIGKKKSSGYSGTWESWKYGKRTGTFTELKFKTSELAEGWLRDSKKELFFLRLVYK